MSLRVILVMILLLDGTGLERHVRKTRMILMSLTLLMSLPIQTLLMNLPRQTLLRNPPSQTLLMNPPSLMNRPNRRTQTPHLTFFGGIREVLGQGRGGLVRCHGRSRGHRG